MALSDYQEIPVRLTPEREAETRARADRTVADEWLLSDCEGDLRVWRVSALRHVTRDPEDGEVSGFSEPSSYRPSDEILAIELDSWDPGEDEDDDRRRRDVGDLFAAREAEPVLLAEVDRLRAEAAEPLTVGWDNAVMWDEDGVIVGCVTDDGRPVALELTHDSAEALGLDLLLPEGDGEVDNPRVPELTARVSELEAELAAARRALGGGEPR